MMVIKDTREKKNKVNFEDLPVGQVYEDNEGVICIKICNDNCENNCICFFGGEWEANTEFFTTKVTPLKTTLLIER